MGGYSFTRLSPNCSKMSKLDRFFITKGIGGSLPNLTAIALKNSISDHRPILISQVMVDFGLTSFRFFNSWMDEKDFGDILALGWNNGDFNQGNYEALNFKNKLKHLKSSLKCWWANFKQKRTETKQTLVKTLKDLDTEIDQGVANQNDLDARSNARANLNILDAKEMKDLAQRSKIKWSIEGDENSKYFYGILNSEHRYLAIKGIKWEGEWVTDAQRVKDTFMEHFRNKFSHGETISVCHRNHRFKSVNETQSIELTRPLSLVELKIAVWSCGNDKALGPDGFTFSLLKRYWDTFEQDIFHYVSEFFNTCFIPSGCNSSFITLIPKVTNLMNVRDYRPISLIGIQYKIIAKVMGLRLAKVVDSVVSMEQSSFIKGRQILDGPLMVNEILELYKKKKKKVMIFIVDFEKAFDSLS
ncbi:putative RNA-directed DNA polymerase, eukaryota, reverse transcriptase zinc-binding domain protein [Tanacetum coccineum]|uniref:RNA-directed DNA polymerase, eukaryota, reverse transcriptase zinc-binding domain protein n=1 Tax=Tanacetum coccineum TaxID=301880 RepID=A0ABQ5B675_9ASTR